MQRTERTRSLASEQSRSALPAVPTRFITPLSLKDVQFSFLFLYYAYPIILNDRLCRIYLFFFSAALFTVVNSKMLN